jgi:integrase/recombinase XerD
VEKALQRYLRHHRAQNRSPKTIQYHRDTLERSLMPFLKSRGHSLAVEDLTADDVLTWVEDQQARGLAQKTIRTRVVSVKAFTRWLAEEEWLPRDPLRKLKVPRDDVRPKAGITPEEAEKLLRACNRSTVTGVRDFAVLLLLFSTGLRASELVNLRREDVDWDKGLITVRRGKGGKFRVVPLGMKVERALTKYLNHPQRPDRDALFLTEAGSAMTYKCLQSLLLRLEERTGVHCNAHLWRHGAAVTYLRSGGRVETLKTMLGHSTLDMTLHYATLAGTDLTTAHETADPARSLKVRV